MNRGFGFLLAIPIFFIAVVTVLQVQFVKQEEMQLEEYILTFAIDYSTDAAVEEMLNMAHLGQDYADQARTNADPEVALSTFLNLMCVNYGLPLTDSAKLQIESGYMPVFCVATYNGYYMYTPTKDLEDGWYLQIPEDWLNRIWINRTILMDEAAVTFYTLSDDGMETEPFLLSEADPSSPSCQAQELCPVQPQFSFSAYN